MRFTKESVGAEGEGMTFAFRHACDAEEEEFTLKAGRSFLIRMCPSTGPAS